MKILVIGDTHGQLNKIREIFPKLTNLDLIAHTGDHLEDGRALEREFGIPVVAVKGNCDGSYSADDFEIIETDYGRILLTHGHLDHVGAAAELAQHYGVPVFGPEKEDEFWLQGLPAQSRMFGLEECQPLTPDRWLNEGDTISIGNVTLQVLHCPGHTPGHVVFLDDRAKLLISGDVIFKGGVGRSDFPRGDHNQLISSIKDKVLPLGDDVTFIPGHGPLSTLGYERLHNPFLQDEMPVW